MDSLIFDWIWLYIQIAILGILILREFLKKRNRNLYIMLISSAMLVLVQGQAWWVFEEFQYRKIGVIRHLYQYISLESSRVANLYAGLCVISLFITYKLLTQRKSKLLQINSIKTQPLKQSTNNLVSYILVAAWTILNGGILIILLGGLRTAIDKPGQSIGGQTLLLIAISIGKLPFLHKLSKNKHFNIIDILLFGITFLLTIINSRFLAIFILGQVVLLFNYCVKQIPRRWLLSGILVLVIIFIIFGLYRDNSNMNVGLEWSDRFQLLLDRLSGEEETPFEWFYRTNVEGFVGLAGILTYERDVGGITYDFGLSNLALFTQFLPNAIRNNADLIKPIMSFLETVYPYPKASVVAPGLETSYAHFGLIGIIFLGTFLGYLANDLHNKMLNPNEDRLKIALISVQSVNLIRTMLRFVLFFVLGDLVALFLYRVILTIAKQRH